MRKIISHTLIYLFFDAVNKAIPFILLPYLTHRLVVNEFGLLELFNTYVALLTLLVMFGVDGWSSANFHKLEQVQFARLLRVGLVCIAVAAVVSLAVLLFLVDDLRFLLAVLYAVGMSLIQLRAILFRLDFKTIQASVLLFINVAVSSLLTIYLFESGFASFESRLVGLMVPVCLLAVWSVYSLWKQFPVLEMAAWRDARQLLKFTLPLLPNGLINFVRFGGDKFFVAHYFGLSVLAVFGVGYQFAMVANIFMLSLNQATMPFMMRCLASKNINKYTRIAIIQFVVFMFFLLAVYMLLPLLANIAFDEKYHLSVDIANLYMLAYPMIFISISLMNMLFFVGETVRILIITMLSALAHLCGLLYVIFMDIEFSSIPYALIVSSFCSLVLVVLGFRKCKHEVYCVSR